VFSYVHPCMQMQVFKSLKQEEAQPSYND